MMDVLYIAPGISTPEIIYEPAEKALCIFGQSYPADSVDFYKPVFEWIEKFLNNEVSDFGIRIIFKLKYYNTASSKQFAKIFKIFEESRISGKVIIDWVYQDYDQDMYEAGKRFSMVTMLKFELKEKKE